MVKSGLSQSKSRSGSGSPAIKSSLARRSDNSTFVNSPDDAGQLASAKTTFQHAQGLSSSSLSQLRCPVTKNHRSSIGNESGVRVGEMDFDEDERESSVESSLCSASQMSLGAISSNSDNIIRRIEQFGAELEAFI